VKNLDSVKGKVGFGGVEEDYFEPDKMGHSCFEVEVLALKFNVLRAFLSFQPGGVEILIHQNPSPCCFQSTRDRLDLHYEREGE